MRNNKQMLSVLLAAGAGLLLSSTVTFAATGYTIKKADEAQIKVGMDKDEVRKLLGRPAHDMKYRNEPGRSWTYGVIKSANPDEINTEFDIDFDPAGKVVKFQERIAPLHTKGASAE